MTQERLETEYPLAAEFFADKQIAERLKKRANGRLKDVEAYWDFVYRKNLGRQHLPKVCVPRLAEHVVAALDDGHSVDGPYCLDNVDVCGVVSNDNRLSLLLLTGLLNSELLDRFMRESVRDRFRGGYLSLNKQYLSLLPIKLPTTPDEKKLAERITQSVRTIMDAKTKLRVPKISDREAKSLEAEIEAHEKRIDEVVFALYGVEGLPS